MPAVWRLSAARHDGTDKDNVWKYAEKSLTWSGWGSPIGLGCFAVALGVTAVLFRYAWVLH